MRDQQTTGPWKLFSRGSPTQIKRSLQPLSFCLCTVFLCNVFGWHPRERQRLRDHVTALNTYCLAKLPHFSYEPEKYLKLANWFVSLGQKAKLLGCGQCKWHRESNNCRCCLWRVRTDVHPCIDMSSLVCFLLNVMCPTNMTVNKTKNDVKLSFIFTLE